MLLSKYIVQKYLQRQLDDWRNLKTLSTMKLEEMLENLAKKKFGLPDNSIKLKTKPRKNQLVGLYIGLLLPQFLYFYDMGIGKTKIALDIISVRHKAGKVKQVLVVVENEANVYNWEEQLEEHSNLSYTLLTGSTEDRRQLLKSESSSVYVITYTGLKYLLCWLQQHPKKKKSSLTLNVSDTIKFAERFDVMVLDEVQNCKNHNSLAYKLCNLLSKYIPVRYGLTGTPMGGDPTDFWSEFYLIDRGATLGNTLGIYRSAFFREQPNPWSGWYDYVFDKKKKKQLMQTIQHRSLCYTDDEVQDLPQLVSINVPVQLEGDAKRHYDIIKGEIKTEETHLLKLKNIFMKMRQAASSFIKTEYGILTFSENQKLEWVISAIQDLPAQDKIVVFYEFIESGRSLSKVLRGKVKYVKLDGSVKDKKSVLAAFTKDSTVRVLLANLESGSVGLNLQVANRVIFYELPVSLITYEQAIKRSHRTGQLKRTYIYYLLAKNTMEPKLLRHLKSGSDLLQAVVRGKETL